MDVPVSEWSLPISPSHTQTLGLILVQLGGKNEPASTKGKNGTVHSTFVHSTVHSTFVLHAADSGLVPDIQ